MTARLVLLAGLSLAVAATGPARAEPPAPGAPSFPMPPSIPPPLGQHGFMMVGDDALAFVPAQARPGSPVPLLILFHGAGGAAQDMMKPFLHEADRRGVALLAVQARAVTWDVVGAHFTVRFPEASMIATGERLPTGDRRRVDSALARFEQAVPVDGKRVGAFGFSDGAAFALSYGAMYSDRIAWVGAMAPAFGLIPPGARARKQRVFIMHGKTDAVIPAAMSQGEVCPAFAASGWTVRYALFDGGHVLDPGAAMTMFTDFLDPASRPPPGSADYRCGGR